MNANAQVFPGTWPAGTPTLGSVDLTYVQPVNEAQFYWSTLQLPVGPVASWVDRNSGKAIVSPGGSQVPLVYSNLRKVIRFDGVNDRMDVPLDLSGPRTVAVVGRFPEAAANKYLMTGAGFGGSFNLYMGSNGNFAFHAGSTIASTKPNDALNHVFLIVSDGAKSVLNIDGQEWAGNAGTMTPTGLRFAASADTYYGADIQAVAVLPFAADAGQRSRLMSLLKTQYQIS